MAKKLAYTVHVPVLEPVDPKKPSGEKYTARHEVFEAGSELPKWAAAVVGDHVYEPDDAAPDKAAEEPSDDGSDDAA
jgi:hypothetical protein